MMSRIMLVTPKMLERVWIPFLGICFVCLLFNCGKPSETEKVKYTEDVAKLISGHTAGLISPSDNIIIRFSKPVVQAGMVGSILKEDPFTFEPNVDGLTTWKDNQTLFFKPNQNFAQNSKYQVEFDIKKIFSNQKNPQIEIQTLKFDIQVAGREVEYMEGDFYLPDINNPEELIYKGEIKVSIPIALDAIIKASSLVMKNQSVGLKWTTDKDNRLFSFISEPVKRESQKIFFEFSLNKDYLGTTNSYKKSFYLHPLRDLVIESIKEVQDSQEMQIQIKFSDVLDRQQDITGLIKVSPDMKIRTNLADNTIFVYGPFAYGNSYSIDVCKGIRSVWGAQTKEQRRFTVKFENLKPSVRFTSTGVILPSTSDKKIRFQTVNLKKVKISILKIFENNLGQYLQTQNIENSDDDYYYSSNRELERVGVIIAEQELFVGDTKNEWLTHEIDLKTLIPEKERGLFHIKLTFTQDDMLYDLIEKNDRNRRWDYNDPNSEAYLYRHGSITKNCILSDLGIIYKQSENKHVVLVMNIPDVKPLSNAKVSLITYQNQVIQEKYTNSDGIAEFTNISDDVFFVQAEKNEERSILKLSDMIWNTSSFDVDGKEVSKEGVRAYIYTERGVYRPGDEVNVTLIARNDKRTFPDNHPVTFELYNPRDQLINTSINKSGINGLYCFNYKTKDSDPTGNWKMKFKVGSVEFQEILKIETVVPNRLKVNIVSNKGHIYSNDRELELIVNANYLFGSPAGGLKAELEATSQSVPKRFDTYKDFTFSNQAIEYKSFNRNLFSKYLNADGSTKTKWTLPKFENIPSALNFKIVARVFEKGGRPNRKEIIIPVDPYENYVGIKLPEFKYGYSTVDESMNIEAIVLDMDGVVVPGKTISYKIYKNNHYWWWEYRRHEDFRLRYKSSTYTEIVKASEIISTSQPVMIEFVPDSWGEYLVEVNVDGNKGHTASMFFKASRWGETAVGPKDASQIILRADKEKYLPGDVAKISFPCPESCTLVKSVEKSNTVISTEVLSPKVLDNEAIIEIPITHDMIPNVYISICLLQPHAQSINDRPIRTYGIIPLLVEDPATKQDLLMTTPQVIRPDSLFNVEIQTVDRKPVQFTIAIVDEGLLDLTNYLTPNPWQAFYCKERLGVKSYDIFPFVIGANIGDVFKTFSIGGDYDEEYYRKTQQQKERAKRFKMISQFVGPLTTDNKGHATIPFTISDYIGSVRVMAVTVRDDCYGSVEKTIPVKNELMLLPSLPRSMGCGDSVSMPVTLFAMEENIGQVVISVQTEGPISVAGDYRRISNLSNVGEKDVSFSFIAKEEVGKGTITIEAKSDKFSLRKVVEIDVRTNSPRIYETNRYSCTPGDSIEIKVPGKGISGTNNAGILISRIPNLEFNSRLDWLRQYPYGCVEQTVSSVFPQLYLKDLQDLTESEKNTIDYNINSGIMRLSNFQTASGGLAYWPGGPYISYWCSTYALHFLVEAQARGYYVPPNLLNNLIRYEKSQARAGVGLYKTQVYCLYVLSLANEAEIGQMNFIKENRLSKLDDTEKWLLAGAYKLAGVERSAYHIIGQAGIISRVYSGFGGTYGSETRDRAIILEMLTLFEQWDRAEKVFEELSHKISSKDWYSTQTLSYSLLSLGKYINHRYCTGNQDAMMKGKIILDDGVIIPFNTKKMSFSNSISSSCGKNIKVVIDPQTTGTEVFINLNWNGIPVFYDQGNVSENLILTLDWLNENGGSINPRQLTQGTSFWECIKVKRNRTQEQTIEEIALVQLLPAGWEIENIRLTSEDVPDWMKKMTLFREEYMDIRDDQIMWFFDLPKGTSELDFIVKINAVTVGKYQLPPTKVEAMYDNTYQAIRVGMPIEVIK